MNEKLQGEQGYLHYGAFGNEITGSAEGVALAEEKFYKIVSVGLSTGLPANLVAKDVFFNKPAVSLKEGDIVKEIDLAKVAFVTNVPFSGSKTKSETTVQMDSVKSFVEGKRAELSGNIDGYFLDEDEQGLQEELISRFMVITKDSGTGTITKKKSSCEPLQFFLSRYESDEVGKKEIIQYMPLIVDSLTMDKPLEGPQIFNFNYTLVGSERPTHYERTITA